MARLFRFALVVALGLLSSVTWPRSAAADDQAVEIDLSGSLTIDAFLRSLSPIVDQPIVWDPKDKAFQREILGPRKVKAPRSRLFDVVQGILGASDCLLIPLGPTDYPTYFAVDLEQTRNILKLHPVPIDLNDGNVGDYEKKEGMFVTATVVVQNLPDLRDVRGAVQRLLTLPNIGNAQEVADAHALVVTDFAPIVCAVYRVVRKLDVAPTYRRIPLQNAVAGKLADLLRDQFVPRGPIAGPDGSLRADDRYRVGADERTNSLLLSGPNAWVDRVAEAALDLDIAPTEARKPR
jgi:hypothetical protein